MCPSQCRLRGRAVWGVIVLAAAVNSAQAAVHDVSVIDFAFSPSELTIAVGDTVRWTSTSPGPAHDVVADDGSFRSEQAVSFVFEYTFNTPGEVPYHCSLHSQPGLNPLTNMNGIIRVQDNGPVFPINAGLSDAWYNPGLAGQGFFITVWEGAKTVFLSWFTYDTSLASPGATAAVGHPGQRWLTAQGAYEGDTARLTVNSTSGGLFSAAQPQPETEAVGSIEITWTGCNEGLLSYELPGAGLQGDIPIERIVLDSVPLCEELAAP